MNQSYVTILEESLQKKKKLLQGILTITMQQGEYAKQDPFPDGLFEKSMTDKDNLLAQLEEADQGFEQIFQRTKEEITGHKEKYKEVIKRMQILIKEVTDLSVEIQTKAARNKTALEQAFVRARKQIRSFKQSSQTASKYYKTMSKTNVDEAIFFNKKK